MSDPEIVKLVNTLTFVVTVAVPRACSTPVFQTTTLWAWSVAQVRAKIIVSRCFIFFFGYKNPSLLVVSAKD